MNWTLFGVAFVAGLLVRDVALLVRVRWMGWKLEREGRAAEARMRGCTHTRTCVVDYGLPMRKCLDCWAIEVDIRDTPMVPGCPYWTPNTSPPPKEAR